MSDRCPLGYLLSITIVLFVFYFFYFFNVFFSLFIFLFFQIVFSIFVHVMHYSHLSGTVRLSRQLLSSIICQLPDVNYGHPYKMLRTKKSIFT